MKQVSSALGVLVLMFAVMSCGLVDRFTTGGVEKLGRADELWSDVPKMDGLEHSDMELPLMVKIIMRTALNNLWRLNKEGEDKTPVEGDWIVFSTTKTPAEVQSFYTNDKMTSFGNWEPNKKSTCVDGSDKGWPGVFCVYQKKDAGKDVGLLILAGQDEKEKHTNVFFLRLTQPAKEGNKP